MLTTMRDYVIGLDVGTGGCKAVAVDGKGSVLSEGSSTYAIMSSRPTWAEQDLHAVVDGAIASVRECLKDLDEPPRALCLDGALHSVLAVDEHGEPLTAALIWADSRSTNQALALKRLADSHALYLRTGCPAHPMFPLAKIIWLRESDPEIFKRAARFVSIKEYLVYLLTREWLADESVASGSGLFNLQTFDWDDDALARAEIGCERLSSIVAAKTEHPGLDVEMARRLGIPAETRLILGPSDSACSNIGAGALAANVFVAMIGSSGAVRTFSHRPLLDSLERTWCYVLDRSNFIVGGAINNAGLVLRWFADNFLGSGKENTYETLIAEAGLANPGASGLVFLPFLTGERSPGWNPQARGVLFGLSLHHHQRHVARAILESVAYRLRSVLEALEEIAGPAKEIRASGGFLRSPLWVQIVSDVLGRRIAIPSTVNTSALGAALFGWHVVGDTKSLRDMERLLPACPVVQSRAAEHAIYSRAFKIYSDLYNELGDSFAEISRFQSDTSDSSL